MATLINNSLENNITTQTQTITFHTQDTYVEDNIVVNNNVKSGSITQNQGNTGNYQNSSVTIGSGGSIYINEGWLPNTQISLDSLLPDEDDMIIVDAIRDGYHGWNDKGEKIVGSMPDVNPEFQGGGITFKEGTKSFIGTEVTLTPSGTITDTATQSTYGITKTLPQNTDNFLSISTDLSIPDNSKITISDMEAVRGAVTYSQNYKGYLDKTQGVQALPSTSQKTSFDVNFDITSKNTFDTYYIPYTNKPEVAGGVAELVPDVSFTNPEVTISGTISSGASTYGITETQPAGSENTDYIKLSKATTSNTESKITPKVTGSVSAVTVSQNAGLVQKSDNEVKKETQTISQNGSQNTTTTTITNNTKDYYIPIVTTTPVIDSTVTDAAVSNSITSDNQNVLLTTPPTGTTYITLTLNSSTTPGSVETTPQINIENAGLIEKGTITGSTKTKSVNVNVKNNPYYIRKYNGSYEIQILT